MSEAHENAVKFETGRVVIEVSGDERLQALEAVAALVKWDRTFARVVLYAVVEPILAEYRPVERRLDVETTWLREALRGYESSYCPHCVQDHGHLDDCPIGRALVHADLSATKAAARQLPIAPARTRRFG